MTIDLINHGNSGASDAGAAASTGAPAGGSWTVDDLQFSPLSSDPAATGLTGGDPSGDPSGDSGPQSLADYTPSVAGGDDAGTQRYYAGLAAPFSISALAPSTAPSDDGGSPLSFNDGSSSRTAGSGAVSYADAFGDAPAVSGPISVSFSAHGGGNSKPGGGGGGGGSTTASYTNGSLTFKVTYDSSVANAPAIFKTAFGTAVQYFLNNFDNPITIALDVGWGEVAGSTIGSGILGESVTSFAGVTYSSLSTQMKNEPSLSPDQQTAYATLPGTSPISGANYLIPAAEAKALGFHLIGKTSLDGAVGFGTLGTGDWNFDSTTTTSQYDFISVADHEISEVMGRVALLGANVLATTNAYSALDLFRYDPNTGARSLVGGQPAYLSFDGGTTNLQNFNTASPGDYGDWAGTSSAGTPTNDAYNAYASTGPLSVSSVDTSELNVLGYTIKTA
ncbi:MAG TPA: NF038122 family metalloprotease [Stellaceae bacterium]|nr:NF038122 family metalloprotease [Stellaceae bacterium]